jgi:hypothetical protein
MVNNALKTLFSDIADAIRSKNGSTETMKPAEFPNKIKDISSGGYAEGYADGKQAEYDAFWDTIQKNGDTYMHYGYMFANGDVWTQEHIEKVKYKNLKANYSSVIFSSNKSITDLSAFSIETPYTPYGNIGKTSYSNTFGGCENLVKSPLLHLGSIGSCPNMFNGCFALEELQTYYDPNDPSGYLTSDLDLQYSTKLNRKSIEDLVYGLSPDTSEKAITLSKVARQNAFTDEEWATLIATKANWAISLV